MDTAPKAEDSDILIKTMGRDLPVHPDFGAGTNTEGMTPGIPYVEVDGKERKRKVTFQYAGESDPGGYPIPPEPPIEGGLQPKGDRHILMVDRDHCRLFEIFEAYPTDNGGWSAGSGAIFDLKSNKLRPDGWTSADAAGLPIFPGLVRYEEVAAGEIRHALRFTVPQTRSDYVWPARHQASTLGGGQYPPMGLRLRLRADFEIKDFSPEVVVILDALKRYGMFLADNGSAWDITGTPDQRWNNDHLHEFARVHGRDFEVVETSGMMLDANSGAVRQPR